METPTLLETAVVPELRVLVGPQAANSIPRVSWEQICRITVYGTTAKPLWR